MKAALAAALLAMASLVHAQPAPGDDPYLWLEDVEAKKSLDWVAAQNAISQPEIEARPGFKALHEISEQRHWRLTYLSYGTKEVAVLAEAGAG